MKNKNKKIYIAILNQGWIRPELSSVLLELTRQNKYDIHLTYPAAKPITNNRNQIVRKFLQTDYDYLMMLDGDNVPPENILNLADYQEDIIGGLCFAYMKEMVIPLALKKNKMGSYDVMKIPKQAGLIECDAVGTGVIIIKREVLEAMSFPFENKYDPEGIKTLGLDINFCKRAKEKGFKVFCHTDFKCSHWTPMDLKEIHNTIITLHWYIDNLQNQLKQLTTKNEIQ